MFLKWSNPSRLNADRGAKLMTQDAEAMMSDKDKVEFLLKLADMSWREYNERRSIEWKTNFALWLALGTFGGFTFQHPTDLPLWLALLTSLILGCIFFVYTFLWKTEIQKRNSIDLDAAQYYWRLVDEELKTTSPAVRTRPGDGKWRRTHLTQVYITLLFVLLATIAVWVTRWAVMKQGLASEPPPSKSFNPTPR